MLNLYLTGVPAHLVSGVREALREIPVALSETGIPVRVTRGDCLSCRLARDEGEIVISKDVELFRALAHFAREGVGCDITEHDCFEKNGLMLDVSRNGVMKPDAVKFLLRRMALMGLNMMMLYTEDTYEIENYPYFGYLRGGYKKDQLRDLDDYAYALGIEMIPCIQTLGHSEKALRWAAMKQYADTGSILLAGDEPTYAFIEQMIKDASEPYRSKRIHIGMDESNGLGTGAYKRKFGERPPMDIFSDHLNRVCAITDKYGLHPMIWSDMYFCLFTPTGDYDPSYELPEKYREALPENVDLIYWDYYHHKQSFMDGVIRQHQKTGNNILFAGGLWNWCVPLVNTDFMLSTSVPALRACRDTGVKEVFTTAWGDCGTQSSIYSLLFGLQLYAEFGYTGEYTPATLDPRFNALNRANADGYRLLGGFDMIPGTSIDDELAPDCSYWLLYEDPMGLYFEKDLEGLPLEEHFNMLWEKCAAFHREAEENGAPEQKLWWDFVEKYARVMADKGHWRYAAPACVRSHDLAAAKELADFADRMTEDVCAMHEAWYQVWFDCNSGYGWDVIDIRNGALIARMKTAARTMHDFADGKIDDIPQLSETKLPYAPQLSYYYRQFGGRPAHIGSWTLAATSQDLSW